MPSDSACMQHYSMSRRASECIAGMEEEGEGGREDKGRLDVSVAEASRRAGSLGVLAV